MRSARSRYPFLTVFLCFILMAPTTCGKDSPTKPKPPEPPPPVTLVPTRIEITPASPKLNSIGQTVQLTARVFDQNSSPLNNAHVAWSSNNLGVAAVSPQGLVTAEGNGVTRITATSGSASAGIDVTVMQSAGSVVIEPMIATLMSLGATVQLTATVLDDNGQHVDDAVVTWQSSDDTVATVSVQGLVTAVSNGAARITATSGSASAGIDVTVMQSAGSVVIEPMIATLMSLGATVQLTATVLDDNGQHVDDAVVTWQSSDDTVATVSVQGLVTAVSNGAARITATSGSASAGIDVTVMQSAGSVVIEPMIATLMSLGATVQLTATVLDDNGQHVDDAVVTWQSSDDTVATVSVQGLVTAVSNGAARITATSGSASAGIDVTVMQEAGSIVIEPMIATLMSLGATVQLTATVLDENGQPIERAVVRWQSGDEAVATVSEQGLVMAEGNGVARITATSGSATSGIAVTVMQEAGSIVIEPEEATLMSLGATVQLTATVLDENGQPIERAVVRWQSGDEAVATVSEQGLVMAEGNGVARITATSGSATSGIAVTVMQEAGSIVIEPEEATLMSLGATVQLTATVLDENGQPIERAVVRWQSGDEAVATVSEQGLVTAEGNGVAHITAASGSVSSGIDVRVMQSAGSVVIEPMIATLMSLGATVQLTATVLDDNGQHVDDAVVTWQSSDDTVATVSVQGLVTAVSNGAARITATSGSASAGIDVTVMQEAGSIVIEPEEATLMSLGETVQLTATVLDQNGQAVSGAMVTWHSGDASVATVSAQGLVTAVSNGVTRIWAGSDNATSSIAVTVQLPVPSPDRDVLVALYNALDGPNWTSNSNWLTRRHVDEWYGVNTDEEGRVVALNLGGNNLKGTLKAQLAQLSYLEGLSLEDNNLTGTIPPELGELANLTLLYLFDNQILGDIPPELGQLENLIHLCLNGNQLSGTIPPELGGLRNLKWLHLHHNASLMGALPRTLVELDLDALLLQGTQVCLPDDPDMEQWLSEIRDGRIGANCEDFDIERIALEVLYHATDGPNWKYSTHWLSDKPLDQWRGVKTDEDGRVTGLDLFANGLSGTIPSLLGQLTNLSNLRLGLNQLSGRIPAELWQLKDLTSLELGGNLLSGELPEGISQLEKLKVLNLHGNLLSGSIPVGMSKIHQLVEVRLGSNQLSGSIPPELGNLSNLTTLSLRGNQLSGQIPPELGNLRELGNLSLGLNNLTGELPAELGNLTNLTRLELDNNMISGSIPPGYGNLSQLESLILRKNGLSGSIPAELGGLTSLQSLVLIGNRLTGTIPPELGRLSNLMTLDLAHNSFQAGPLPIELTVLKNLGYLNLQASSICIPEKDEFREWLDTIGWVASATFCNNPERDALVALYHATGGQDWIDNTNWLSDLSLQEWHGVTIDASSRVEHLSLESNDLNGVVSDALGQLTELSRLDLRDNPLLTDALPISLTNVPLESLRLEGTQVCAPTDAGFETWLMSIPERSGIVNCDEIPGVDDRNILERFYHLSNGPNWNNDENWLSAKPLDEWFGISTDANGRVTGIQLRSNNLTGALPQKLSQLAHLRVLDLYGNKLSGTIPSDLGQLSNLTNLTLWSNRLTGSIPIDLSSLADLDTLNLTSNQLTGSIPADFGQLTNLRSLRLPGNELTGNLPPELGRLSKLAELSLGSNQLSGEIPTELAELEYLKYLDLGGNRLTGSIPVEFGQLTYLESLNLSSNKLTGNVPPELGELSKLTRLSLGFNQLSGEIPAELGQLSGMGSLDLKYNSLTGEIPAELGRMTGLYTLWLEENMLSGSLPPELSKLEKLVDLALRGNAGLSGPIPESITRLNLNRLTVANTQLCALRDTGIREWLKSIPHADLLVECPPSLKNPDVYLTQTVQSFDRPVPLIEGEPALLRVFFSTDEVVSNRPPVRAKFYLDGAEVHRVDIPSGAAKIPLEIDEGSLEKSANAVVPGSVMVPGLEVVVEIAPDGMLDTESGISMRIPESGRMDIDVQPVPPFDLTLVPLLWSEDPDYTVVTESEGLTADDALFRLSRDLYPINDFQVIPHEPLIVSLDPVHPNAHELLKEVLALQKMEGKGGHYMGILRNGGNGGRYTGAFLSLLRDVVIAHELGHNLSLSHAPCGSPNGVDPYYPYPGGNIGAWGYDILSGELINPNMPDIMSYCYPPAWISDYHFNRTLQYRQSERYRDIIAPDAASTATRTLLLWGGVDEYGGLSLEPAFVVESPPSLPGESGPYRLTGEDKSARTLFEFSFEISELSHGEGGVFAFTIPVHTNWLDRLTRITLSGPEGLVEMTRGGDRSAALLLDQSTGQIRGILRGWPEQGTTVQGAHRVLPEPGLELIESHGIPGPVDW